MTDSYVANNRSKINAQRRARYAKNSAPTLAQNRAYRKRKAKELNRLRRLRTYGTDGEALWQVQKGKCAICKTDMLRRHRHRKAAHLDHDHKTKKVRAWLCSTCNVGIGHFKDNPTLVEQAARYLRQHE